MVDMNFKFVDHSDDVLRALADNKAEALEAIGLAAEGFAKENLAQFPRRKTGRLINSVSHSVEHQHDTVYIGTNVEYAPYVEFGTGPMAEGRTADGKQISGRQDVPWFYKDEKGKWHASYGMKPAHFLKNAASRHGSEYKRIAERYMRGGKG